MLANIKNTLPDISVVIPTHKQRFLSFTLQALARQKTRFEYEVLIVENGELDHQTEQSIKRFNDVLTIKHLFTEVAGLNYARNLGVESADSPLIALLDDDTEPDDGWLNALVLAHEREPQLGVIGGKTMLRFLTSPPLWITGYFRNVLSEVDWGPKARPCTENEWIVGANMSFTRKVFDSVGSFSNDLGMSGRRIPQLCNDESEFCYRAAKLGTPGIYYDPRILVQHIIPDSRLKPSYFIHRFYGQGLSTIKMLSINTCNSQLCDAAWNIIKTNFYSPSWLMQIEHSAAQLASPEKNQFIAMSGLCRLAYLQGLIDEVSDVEKPCTINCNNIESSSMGMIDADPLGEILVEPEIIEVGQKIVAVLATYQGKHTTNKKHSRSVKTVVRRLSLLRNLLKGSVVDQYLRELHSY